MAAMRPDPQEKGETVEYLENATPPMSSAMEKRIVSKIDMRLMPGSALVYLLCYLDRSNIGNAKILNTSTGDDMLTTNHMSNYQYTIALMLFILGYCTFEAPSNLALKMTAPHRWLGFLVIIFGVLCAGIAGTTSFAGVAALRFLLGAAEAGVLPGLIFYMSFWYKPEERAMRIAIFLCSSTLAGAFGGSIAYGVGHMNGARGLEAWRWLFLIEGVPTIFVGICVAMFMPDYPENASWLSEEEQLMQCQRVSGSNSAHKDDKLSWHDAKQVLKDPRLLVHYLMYLCAGCGVTSLSLFSPVIVAGLGYQDLQAQLFTIPPYAAAYVYTLFVAYYSDHRRQRGVVCSCSFALAAVMFIVLASMPGDHFQTRYAFLCIATCGVFGGLPSLCAWVADNVRSTTAVSIATALNVGFSGPGQIIGVWIYRSQDKPLYRLGHGVNAAFMVIGALLSSAMFIHYTRLNKKLVGTSERRWMA